MFDGTWNSLSEDDAIAFSSSNADVVSVASDGLVTSVGPGMADVVLVRDAATRGVVPVLVYMPIMDALLPIPDNIARRGEQDTDGGTADWPDGLEIARSGQQ